MKQFELIQSEKSENEAIKNTLVKTADSMIEARKGRSLESTRSNFETARESTLGQRPKGKLTHEAQRAQVALEAIVLERHRPAWFIIDDKLEIKEDDEVGAYPDLELIKSKKKDLETLCEKVGRVDLFHSHHKFVGTGWLIESDLVVTNAHVARLFSESLTHGGWQFQQDFGEDPVEARLDMLRQKGQDRDASPRRVNVLDILYVAGDGEPDIAFLKVDNPNKYSPLELDTKLHKERMPVAVVGYPARNDETDPHLMRRLFGTEFNVKRFAPGYIYKFDDQYRDYLGDYTSLGGNSGSAVLSLDTHKVVALHYAGAFKTANYSVPSDLVFAAKRLLRTRVAVPEFPSDRISNPDKFAGRTGYDPDFLGNGAQHVSLPDWSQYQEDVAPVEGNADHELKYTHFSVVQSKSRRLPLLTAVNIDGEKAFKLKRIDKWLLDGRLSRDHQIGNALYVSNRLDRGHLVRRMDPGWGATRDEAQQGELDSFHYTNCAPQHENLNRRHWVGLEDYILESATTKDFKASVFTGPVFRDTDKPLKHQPGATGIKIPEEYWKVAVMVNSNTGKLSATGYILSQGKMIRGMTESAFVLGAYRVYQVQISKIEKQTGLTFGNLRNFDPLGRETESQYGNAAFEIQEAIDLKL